MKKRIYCIVVFVLMVGLVIVAWPPNPAFAQTPKSKAAPPPPGEIRVGLNVALSGPQPHGG